jgi:hypothetical protein
MVVRPLAYHSRHSAMCQYNRSRVVANSAGSGEPVLTLMDATISLNLIFHSMVLSQPPSCETVPYTSCTSRYRKTAIMCK